MKLQSLFEIQLGAFEEAIKRHITSTNALFWHDTEPDQKHQWPETTDELKRVFLEWQERCWTPVHIMSKQVRDSLNSLIKTNIQLYFFTFIFNHVDTNKLCCLYWNDWFCCVLFYALGLHEEYILSIFQATVDFPNINFGDFWPGEWHCLSMPRSMHAVLAKENKVFLTVSII